MSKKMLIDSSHAEETRVVVLDNNNIEEYDFETTHKRQIKGNIYLAKVTRIEPSLQAAFVDYGGNRHGFLAFSDIHPDYYQIPKSDREELLENPSEDEDSIEEDITLNETESEEDQIETLHDDDSSEITERRKFVTKKRYQIHEVIKKRQILLVQIVKEERGNKGAALTTFISLAGRYSVLMPNTNRGGNISRKITNAQNRKHLKTIVQSLDIPQGIGVILRTAAANRTKIEIKRDYDYLLRLWDNIRDFTLSSIAPCLIHEEGSLIKRSIRDLYSKDIEEILVSGEESYREAKDFMRMLMPSHAKAVQPYRETQPIFTKYGIEERLDDMLQPTVKLKSGGYLVIEQTEALVSIDVNSGKSNKQSNIEKTALQTNLEAAAEVARQLRLRDLAGLVIIDFIDMADRRNIRLVEKELRDCLKNDRARIQIGRISPFGLVEMSRQRIRSSVLESTMQVCTTCQGAGYVRSPISVAIYILRLLEEYLLKDSSHNLKISTLSEYGIALFNKKKSKLVELEQRFEVMIDIELTPQAPEKFVIIEKNGLATKSVVITEQENIGNNKEQKAENEDKEDKKQQRLKETPSKNKKRNITKKAISDKIEESADETVDIASATTENLSTESNSASNAKPAEVKKKKISTRRTSKKETASLEIAKTAEAAEPTSILEEKTQDQKQKLKEQKKAKPDKLKLEDKAEEIEDKVSEVEATPKEKTKKTSNRKKKNSESGQKTGWWQRKKNSANNQEAE